MNSSVVYEYLPRYTIEDYKRWEGDWELIHGIAYAMTPSPFGRHQRILMEIGWQFTSQLKHCSIPCYVYPELDWIVDEETVLRPDLMVVCKEVLTYLKEPPEVVVEITSKSSLQKDTYLKFSIYEKEKVAFYVLVYPEIQKVKIYALIQNKFEKVFDNDSGSFEFELKNGCKFSLNLDILWPGT